MLTSKSYADLTINIYFAIFASLGRKPQSIVLPQFFGQISIKKTGYNPFFQVYIIQSSHSGVVMKKTVNK